MMPHLVNHVLRRIDLIKELNQLVIHLDALASLLVATSDKQYSVLFATHIIDVMHEATDDYLLWIWDGLNQSAIDGLRV